MTKKDYVKIAAAIAEARGKVDSIYSSTGTYRASAYIGILAVTDSIADMFAEDNPKFDRDRFLKAAKGEE